MKLLETYYPVSSKGDTGNRMLRRSSQSIGPNHQGYSPEQSITEPGLQRTLKRFSSVSLDNVNHATLLDRAESKYMLHRKTLPALLECLRPHYQLLVVEDSVLARYRTLYYDTENFAFYHCHHAGIYDRYKIRAREYVDSSLSFLEVKHKTNRKRTIKHRLRIDAPAVDLSTMADSEMATAFLQEVCPYTIEALNPVLWNHYRRITLVNPQTSERVTLDIDLAFSWQDRYCMLSPLIIAEVKQAKRKQPSPFVAQMMAARIPNKGFSKYCMGVTLLYPDVKANRFKKMQRYVAKLLQESPWAGIAIPYPPTYGREIAVKQQEVFDVQ